MLYSSPNFTVYADSVVWGNYKAVALSSGEIESNYAPADAKSDSMVISKSGEVLSVNGVDEAIDNTISRLDVPNMSKMQIKASVKNSFGAVSLKSSFEIIFRCYPVQPVAIGDSWNNSVELKLLGKTTKNNSWTLKFIDDGEVTIIGNAKMAVASADKSFVVNGMNARASFTGTEQSTFKLDLKTGWINSGTSTSTFEGTMETVEHQLLTGVRNDMVLHNLRYLVKEGKRVIVRFPLIPGLNDGEQNLKAMAVGLCDRTSYGICRSLAI